MGETVQYETRKKDTQLEKKTRNTNKICETRIKGAKFEENVQNTNENMRNYETKQIFLFRETTRNTFFRFFVFFQFRETIETRRNSNSQAEDTSFTLLKYPRKFH